MIDAALEIERLLQFAGKHRLVEKLDKVIARNELLDLLNLKEPYYGYVPDEELKSPVQILDNLVQYVLEINLIDREIPALREIFDTKLMGCLMPRESEIIKTFRNIAENETISKATDYFYELCQVSNYIRTAQIAKNIIWEAKTEYGNLEITINLSKPEKDPKEIALERLQPKSNYPKCMLCLENIGYQGRINFPARQTHRVIPITLKGQNWYLQYSPYLYYNEHCIIFDEKHEPMVISKEAFELILDFIRQFPHYICGSNADLPIVGGSILSHNHFQGGNHTFPMHKASSLKQYSHSDFKNVCISILKWPMSVIRASSDSIDELAAFSGFVLSQWRNYSDEEAQIIAFTKNGSEKILHNTITPIGRVNPDGKYEMDLVLRNNRTSFEHPDGIFHPHKEIHHIKKENIGLIEVMGLAILPGRLTKEIQKINEILTGKVDISSIKDDNDLDKHSDWIKYLVAKYGTLTAQKDADKILEEEIGNKFKTCLEHSGVFKQSQNGLCQFNRFLLSIGCKE